MIEGLQGDMCDKMVSLRKNVIFARQDENRLQQYESYFDKEYSDWVEDNE